MQLKIGDPIIYRKRKSSERPGPRAKQVFPLKNGDKYHYVVDKFWTVTNIREDGSFEVVTRTGKRHKLDQSDPNIHKPRLLEQVIYRSRFPQS